MKAQKLIQRRRLRRRRHVRRKVIGTESRPRLTVFRSGRHIYCQMINDHEGRTLVSASSTEKEFRTVRQNCATAEAAAEIGKLVASRALKKGISAAVFDRGPYKYHGRVKALAEGAREAGLKF
ncbi:MAG: 50S ribosomal protein L18 [Planctomycetota bacterium]|nr:MAG: 50S ribosomal protein L18 [Planctomycetota bacterium]